MLSYALRRIGHALPMLLLVTFFAFGVQTFAEIDPARMALTSGAAGVAVTDEQLAAKRAELGLDRPIWRRYATWLQSVARLDLGRSYASNREVSQLLGDRIPASLGLAGLAWLVSLLVSIPLGLLLAARAGSTFDVTARTGMVLLASLPPFWIGLLAIWLFAARLQWIPALGSFTPKGIILPALILAITPATRLTRLLRTCALEQRRAGYVLAATGRGLSARAVWSVHILPNAVLPAISVIGLDFASLLAGAAVVETVFAWPGVGNMAVTAAATGDLPILMALILFTGCATILANIGADLVAAAIDPRRLVA